MIDAVDQRSWQHDRHHSKEIVFVSDFFDDDDTGIHIQPYFDDHTYDMDMVLDDSQATYNEDNHTNMSKEELGQIENIWLDSSNNNLSRRNSIGSQHFECDWWDILGSEINTESSSIEYSENDSNMVDVVVSEDKDKSSQEGLTTFTTTDITLSQVISPDIDLLPRNHDHCAAPSERRNSDISLDESRTAAAFDSFRTAMVQSQYSRRIIEDWDEKMGLSRVHSRTMMKSEKSRKKLYENVLPTLRLSFCNKADQWRPKLLVPL